MSTFDIAPHLQSLADHAQDTTPERPFTVQLAAAEALPEIAADPDVFTTLLALVMDVCRDLARTGDVVHVGAQQLPSGITVSFRLAPGPAIQVIFKGVHETGDRKPAPEMLATSPDSLIAFLLAQKIALRHGMKIWLDIDPAEAQFNLYIHDYRCMKTVDHDAPRVLIIEDVVPIGTLLEYYLAHAGFKALRAHNGDMGVHMAHEHLPDMITLDLMMPEKDGWEVLEELKSADDTRPIPVVLISVLKYRLVGYERGASDYLGKPVIREELIETARRLTCLKPVARRALSAVPSRILFIATTGDADAAPQSDIGMRVRTLRGEDRFFMTDLQRDPEIPDLILLDMSTPREALGAANRVRLIDAFDAVPMIAICGESDARLLRARARGIIDACVTPGDLRPEAFLSALAAEA
ncbi:MAG: response regulator [Ignavibacteria bacterium]|nr:response regulator [Ignavibacteria bacterium]